jgi:hypothetical protein
MENPLSQLTDECTLRESARAAIRMGKLPARRPDRTFGGLGSGTTCAVCGTLITLTQLEIEAEFVRRGVTPETPHADPHEFDRYHSHPRCFAAWECEIHQP